MTIIRPYNAEDNEYNKEMLRVVEHYTNKIGEVITEVSIYTYSVVAKTESGRTFISTKADGCRSRYTNVRNYIYLKERTEKKDIRIKKADW